MFIGLDVIAGNGQEAFSENLFLEFITRIFKQKTQNWFCVRSLYFDTNMRK